MMTLNQSFLIWRYASRNFLRFTRNSQKLERRISKLLKNTLFSQSVFYCITFLTIEPSESERIQKYQKKSRKWKLRRREKMKRKISVVLIFPNIFACCFLLTFLIMILENCEKPSRRKSKITNIHETSPIKAKTKSGIK
jgi:hypothetical protein